MEEKPAVTFLAYLAFFLNITAYALFLLCGILIPFTIGVSVILMPVPIVLWVLSWLALTRLKDSPAVSPKARQKLQTFDAAVRGVCRKMKKPALWGGLAFLIFFIVVVIVSYVFKKTHV